MQTKIHYRNTQSTKQLSRNQTKPLQQRLTHNNTSINTRLHAAKRLTQPKRLIGEIVDIAKKQDNYQALKGLTEKISNDQQN